MNAVYCRHCGVENRDDAIHCASCGAALRGPTRLAPARGYDDACFGLPRGGAIIGLIIGLFIIIAGISSLPGITLWPWLWALFLLVVGAAIVLVVLAKLIRW